MISTLQSDYSVHFMRRRDNGAMFAVLRNTGAIVGAYGPLGQNGKEIAIQWSEWNSDLGRVITANAADYKEIESWMQL